MEHLQLAKLHNTVTFQMLHHVATFENVATCYNMFVTT